MKMARSDNEHELSWMPRYIYSKRKWSRIVLTLGNNIYFARKVDGFVWICKTISYYAKFNNHYNFIWCFCLSNFWLKSKSDGFLIDMILAVFSNRKWSAFLWICWNHVTKVTFFNLINILLCGSQWLNPCVKYQKLISHKTLNCQLFVISMEIEDFIID